MRQKKPLFSLLRIDKAQVLQLTRFRSVRGEQRSQGSRLQELFSAWCSHNTAWFSDGYTTPALCPCTGLAEDDHSRGDFPETLRLN